MKSIHAFGIGLILLGASGTASQALADSAADALLKSVTPATGAATEKSSAPSNGTSDHRGNTFAAVTLDDAFLSQFYAVVQAEPNLSYDARSWAQHVFSKQFTEAAHQWSAIQSQIPDTFRVAAQSAWVYLLWRLDLPQAFFDEWIHAVSQPAFREHRLAVALEQVVAPGFDRWLVMHSIILTPEEMSLAASFEKSPAALQRTVYAWSLLRAGDRAAAIASSLPLDNALKIPLAQTAALGFARKKDLASAGHLLKTQLEPAIEYAKDPKLLSRHYLEVARLLFQVGAIDGAIDYYQKIPERADDYLKAREELTWALLRKGDTERLRGQLATLSQPGFHSHFAPEVPLVRAISNLKLCYYDRVEKDFADFIATNSVWAKKIDQALKSENPPAPEHGDFYAELAEKAAIARAAEMAKLDELGTASIGATLPAVGPQSHWVKLRDQMRATLEFVKKQQVAEYRRQWANEKTVLAEAIRKMQFVKVELLSQVRSAAEDGISTKDSLGQSQAKSVSHEENQIVFPFDGVLWPDELFKLKSIAQNRCLQMVKQESK